MALPISVLVIRRRSNPAPRPIPYGPMPILAFLIRRRNPANVPIVYPTFLDALVAKLEAEPRITSLVGQKLFPKIVPQWAKLPALTYQVISDVHGVNLSGSNNTYRMRVQFSIHSEDYGICVDTVKAIHDVFNGKSGQMGGIGGFKVLSSIVPNELDLYDPDLAGSDEGTFMIPIDVNFNYRGR